MVSHGIGVGTLIALLYLSYRAGLERTADNPSKKAQNSMSVLRINYKELGLPVGPYTHAVIHQNTLYTSGMTAFASPAETRGIDEQLEEIFRQINLICERQHTSLSNLIKVTVFVTDLNEMQQARETLFAIYAKHIPASSLVQVGRLFSDSLKVEVEAIIALPAQEAE